jgi:transposase
MIEHCECDCSILLVVILTLIMDALLNAAIAAARVPIANHHDDHPLHRHHHHHHPAADDEKENEYQPSPHTHLNVEQRWAIITLWKDGQLRSVIEQKLGVSQRTIRRWIDHYQQYHTVDDKPRSGRPRITTDEEDEMIVMGARVQPFTSARQITRELELDVDRRTVDRRLIEAGLHGRVARH